MSDDPKYAAEIRYDKDGKPCIRINNPEQTSAPDQPFVEFKSTADSCKIRVKGGDLDGDCYAYELSHGVHLTPTKK